MPVGHCRSRLGIAPFTGGEISQLEEATPAGGQHSAWVIDPDGWISL